MKRSLFIALALGFIAASSAGTHASIRVNGNQLLEGSGEYDLKFQKGARVASSRAPARLIFALGQGIIADGRLPDSGTVGDSTVAVRIGIGLGFDIATVVYNVFCPITLTGDLDVDGDIDVMDILMLVNFVFKDGEFPRPCMASGDVNCSGDVTTSDALYLVSYVFEGGPAPCDVCTLIPEVWSCP